MNDPPWTGLTFSPVFGDVKCNPTTPFLKSLLSHGIVIFFLQKLYLSLILFSFRAWVGIGTHTGHIPPVILIVGHNEMMRFYFVKFVTPPANFFVLQPLSSIRMSKPVSSVACLTETVWCCLPVYTRNPSVPYRHLESQSSFGIGVAVYLPPNLLHLNDFSSHCSESIEVIIHIPFNFKLL